MKRQDVEHIIRASGAITDEYEFVIVGSTRLRIIEMAVSMVDKMPMDTAAKGRLRARIKRWADTAKAKIAAKAQRSS